MALLYHGITSPSSREARRSLCRSGDSHGSHGLCPPVHSSSSVPSCLANWYTLAGQPSSAITSWVPAQLSPSRWVGDSGRLSSLPSLHRHVLSSLRGYCGRVTGELVNSVTAYASSPLETRDKQAETREYCSI